MWNAFALRKNFSFYFCNRMLYMLHLFCNSMAKILMDTFELNLFRSWVALHFIVSVIRFSNRIVSYHFVLFCYTGVSVCEWNMY